MIRFAAKVALMAGLAMVGAVIFGAAVSLVQNLRNRSRSDRWKDIEEAEYWGEAG